MSREDLVRASHNSDSRAPLSENWGGLGAVGNAVCSCLGGLAYEGL